MAGEDLSPEVSQAATPAPSPVTHKALISQPSLWILKTSMDFHLHLAGEETQKGMKICLKYKARTDSLIFGL